MKTCTKCNTSKSFTDFGRNVTKADGYNYWCKLCAKDYYHNNKETARDYARSNRAKLAEELKIVKENKPCADCGVIYPHYAMDFDHVAGEKSFNMSTSRSVSRTRFYAELEKCEIVCANCHRGRTYKRNRGLL